MTNTNPPSGGGSGSAQGSGFLSGGIGGSGPAYESIAVPDDFPNSVYDIVLSYLAQHCYSDTVQALLDANNATPSTGDPGSGGSVGGIGKSLATPHRQHASTPATDVPSTPANGNNSRRPTTRSVTRSGSSSRKSDAGMPGKHRQSFGSLEEDTGEDATMADVPDTATPQQQQQLLDGDGDLEMGEAPVAQALRSPAKALLAPMKPAKLPSLHSSVSSVRSQWEKLVSSLEQRKTLYTLIVEGNVDRAILFCKQAFPNILVEAREGEFQALPSSHSSLDDQIPLGMDRLTVTFQLHCQQYIELVRQERQAEALQYAQEVLSGFGVVRPKFRDTLRDVVALIAYQDPSKSPVAHFLHQSHREQVAELLNSAILAHGGMSSKPALELLVKHVTVLRELEYTEANAAGKEKKATSGKNLQPPRWRLADFLQSDA